MRNYKKEQRNRRYKAGLCIRCGKNKYIKGYTICLSCSHNKSRLNPEEKTFLDKCIDKFCKHINNNNLDNKLNTKIRNTLRILYRKKLLIDTFGGKCMSCNNKYPICVFEFHHINRKDNKNKMVSWMKYDLRNNKLQQEQSKIMLLCSNCHAKIHSKNQMEFEILFKRQLENIYGITSESHKLLRKVKDEKIAKDILAFINLKLEQQPELIKK